MHPALCLCAGVTKVDLVTRVIFIMHHREVAKTTATARLPLMLLSNAEVHLHGEAGSPLDLRSLHEQGRRVMVLFPSEGAATLTPDLVASDRRPVTLVVPDGSWRQASRAARRIPGLPQAEAVVLPPGPPSRYRLRQEPKPGGLATCEAVARALGLLESEAAQHELEALFERMVEGTLATRNQPRSSKIAPAPHAEGGRVA
jgi:DTW domain-containing protein YfiP